MKKKILFIVFFFFLVCGIILSYYFIILNKENSKKLEEGLPEILEEEEPVIRKISIVMVGDALIHCVVYLAAKQKGGSYGFSSKCYG